MRLKSYFAQSIGDAIESARLELGPEAMLLNSRKTSPEQSYLGEFEVVFGIAGNPPALKKIAPAERPVSSRLSSAKRIFPELMAAELPEATESEAPATVLVKQAGTNRIFPELAEPEPPKPDFQPVESVRIEETIATVEAEIPVATNPLFPKASPPVPASAATTDNPIAAAAKDTASELPAVPVAPVKQAEGCSSQDIAREL